MKKLSAIVVLALLPILAPNLHGQVSMVSEEGKFKVTFPGDYTHNEQSIDTDLGTVLMHMYMFETEESAYMVSFNDYPEESFDNSFNTEALEGAKTGFTGNLGMEESYSLEIRLSGHPGLYYKASGNGLYAIMYVLVRDNRLYQVGVLSQGTYADPAFLESFELID